MTDNPAALDVVSVPREATEAMVEAGARRNARDFCSVQDYDVNAYAERHWPEHADAMESNYRAMIAAAPPAPVVSPDVADLIARLEKDADAWAATSDHDGGGDTYSGALMREAARALGSSAPVVDREAVAELMRLHIGIGEIGECSIEILGYEPAADAILALLAPPAHREADGWQDIAAHDGSEAHVLLFESGCVFEARLTEEGWYERNNESTDHWGGECRPTHWQPLPAPPTPRAMTQGEG